MAFTDEDLKKLRFLRDAIHKEINSPGDIVSFSQIDALLARLEAAERYCETQAFKERIAWKVSKGELTGKVKLMKASGKEPK